MTEAQVDLRQLPEGWVWTTIGEIAETATGTTPSKKDPDNYGDYVPFVKPPELDDCIIDKAHDNLSKKGAELARILPSNSVLVSCIGILGKTGINRIPVAFNQQINAVIFPNDVIPRFGFYYFQTFKAREWLNKIASATTVSIVNRSKFDTTPFPLAPTSEQSRIVSRVEELFSCLDAGVESLLKVKTLLKRYRQAVLKYAFEGKLTEEWRKTHKNQTEPAQKLLEQIKQERKKKVDAKHKEQLPINTTGLSEIPDNWVWTSIDALFDVGSGGTPSRRKPEYWNGSIPWITSGEVAFGEIKDTKGCITQEGMENSSAKLYPPGTVLLALYGEGKTRGQAAILRLSATTNQAIACILCSGSPIPPEYVYWWLRYRYYETRSIGEGANQPNMYLHHVRRMAIPLAPLMEQEAIVERIKHDLSMVDKMEDIFKQSFQRSEKLRQSILKRAFEGKLVPQDPADESANRLLAQIKEERAKHENRTNNVVDQEEKGLMRYVK